MSTDKDLYAAISRGDVAEVSRMLADEDGISYAHAYDYTTPLLQAVEAAQENVVRLLIQSNRYAVDEGDELTCYSPLMAACKSGNLGIAQLLIEMGADVNRQFCDGARESYPIAMAADGGFKDIVALLNENGADLEYLREDDKQAVQALL